MASAMRKVMVFLGLRDEEDGEHYLDLGYDDEPSLETMPPVEAGSSRVRTISPSERMPSRSGDLRAEDIDIVLIADLNDAQEVAEVLKDRRAVVMDVSSCDRDLRRRLVDFASGVAYGLNGSMQRVGSSDSHFLITPHHLSISDDELAVLAERSLVAVGV